MRSFNKMSKQFTWYTFKLYVLAVTWVVICSHECTVRYVHGHRAVGYHDVRIYGRWDTIILDTRRACYPFANDPGIREYYRAWQYPSRVGVTLHTRRVFGPRVPGLNWYPLVQVGNAGHDNFKSYKSHPLDTVVFRTYPRFQMKILLCHA